LPAPGTSRAEIPGWGLWYSFSGSALCQLRSDRPASTGAAKRRFAKTGRGIRPPGVKPRTNLRMLFLVLPAGSRAGAKGALGRSSIVPPGASLPRVTSGLPPVPPVPPTSRRRHGFPIESGGWVARGCRGGGWRVARGSPQWMPQAGKSRCVPLGDDDRGQHLLNEACDAAVMQLRPRMTPRLHALRAQTPRSTSPRSVPGLEPPRRIRVVCCCRS
jgi:hypothetical protein